MILKPKNQLNRIKSSSYKYPVMTFRAVELSSTKGERGSNTVPIESVLEKAAAARASRA